MNRVPAVTIIGRGCRLSLCSDSSSATVGGRPICAFGQEGQQPRFLRLWWTLNRLWGQSGNWLQCCHGCVGMVTTTNRKNWCEGIFPQHYFYRGYSFGEGPWACCSFPEAAILFGSLLVTRFLVALTHLSEHARNNPGRRTTGWRIFCFP